MQVDRMCSAKAATTISKTNKKQTWGHLFNERVIVHCLIMAQRQRLETADLSMEKGEKR